MIAGSEMISLPMPGSPREARVLNVVGRKNFLAALRQLVIDYSACADPAAALGLANLVARQLTDPAAWPSLHDGGVVLTAWRRSFWAGQTGVSRADQSPDEKAAEAPEVGDSVPISSGEATSTEAALCPDFNVIDDRPVVEDSVIVDENRSEAVGLADPVEPRLNTFAHERQPARANAFAAALASAVPCDGALPHRGPGRPKSSNGSGPS